MNIRTIACAGILSVVLGACVSDGPERQARPKPGPQPHNAVPTHLVVNVKDFVDSDENGYLDTGIATVYVFSEGYSLPLDVAGAFTFRLFGPSGDTLAEWVITPEQSAPCRIKTQVGPGFGFTLDLRHAGAEMAEHREAALVGEFTDSKGRAIRSGRISVTLGRAR